MEISAPKTKERERLSSMSRINKWEKWQSKLKYSPDGIRLGEGEYVCVAPPFLDTTTPKPKHGHTVFGIRRQMTLTALLTLDDGVGPGNQDLSIRRGGDTTTQPACGCLSKPSLSLTTHSRLL